MELTVERIPLSNGKVLVANPPFVFVPTRDENDILRVGMPELGLFASAEDDEDIEFEVVEALACIYEVLTEPGRPMGCSEYKQMMPAFDRCHVEDAMPQGVTDELA